MSRPRSGPRRPHSPEPRKRSAPQREPGSARSVAIATTIVTVLVVGSLVMLKAAEPKPVPVQRDPAVLAAGEQLFSGTCAACHGTDLRGTDNGPSFLLPTYAPNHHGDEAFQQAVAVGVPPHHWGFGPMPPQSGLTRDEVAMIVAYVRTAQEAAGVFFDPAH